MTCLTVLLVLESRELIANQISVLIVVVILDAFLSAFTHSAFCNFVGTSTLDYLNILASTLLQSAMADNKSGCPYRQYMDEPGIQWREGKPNYTKVNKAYLEGRTRTHKEGSLEKIVEDLVKTWEMEASHKTRIEDWQTVDREAFTIRANNQRSFKLKEAIKEGNYNILMQNQPLYNSEAHTFESSHNLFRSAFSEGFPWELLEVFSGPPRVAFSWRHWAHWTGPYKGRAPTGELLELHGMAVAEVDENLKIKSIDVHYDPNQLLMKLEGKQ